jgi:hypothetical protein
MPTLALTTSILMVKHLNMDVLFIAKKTNKKEAVLKHI